MKRILILPFWIVLTHGIVHSQVTKNLEQGAKKLLQDSQMKHALLGIYVVNSTTGNVICNINGNTGMVPASTLKVVTAATAFDLLGTKFRYKTIIGYDGNISNGSLSGNLYIAGQGDPTLGSPRYASTQSDSVLHRILSILKNNGIHTIQGDIILDGYQFSYQPTPPGWTWNNIGNYYGAGCWGINWRENQYDIFLQSGNNEGDDVAILRTEPALQQSLIPLLKTGKKESEDNADIYLPAHATIGYIDGTIPAGEKNFKISGSLPNPCLLLAEELSTCFTKEGITLNGNILSSSFLIESGKPVTHYVNTLDSLYSPSLDSIAYWFLRKSINLYGESLIKLIAVQQNKQGSTNAGVDVIRTFWQDKDVEKSALKMIDGSGLSPQNRITPKSLVQVLQYAKLQPWYHSYMKGFPTYNDMKMKSGTISGVKGFTGYHTSKNGTAYTFAIIVNNYDGATSAIVCKMYALLDMLK